MKNPLLPEQIKQIGMQIEADPNTYCITGNKTLDAFAEYLLRRTLATAEEEDDDSTVVYTPSSSVASASGTEAQDSQATGECESAKKKSTKASFVGTIAKLLGIATATNTQDEAKPGEETKTEAVSPMVETDSHDQTSKPNQRTASIFLGPDFKADLAKTAALYVILDLVALTPTATGLNARFAAILVIFTLMKINTLSKLEESMKDTANDKASLEKEGTAVSCQALIAMALIVKLAFFS